MSHDIDEFLKKIREVSSQGSGSGAMLDAAKQPISNEEVVRELRELKDLIPKTANYQQVTINTANTLTNQSNVSVNIENTFAVLESKYGSEIVDQLRDIKKIVDHESIPAAEDHYELLLDELARPTPRPSILKTLCDTLVGIVPVITTAFDLYKMLSLH